MRIAKQVLVFAAFTTILFFGGAIGAGSAETKSPEASVDPSRVGPGLAVTAFSKEDGFQLSDKAMRNLEIQFATLPGGSPWRVPGAALVTLKHSVGVYRRYDRWITLVLVKVLKKEAGITVIQSEDLQAGDEIATAGVSFLRMTEADLNSDTVDNCAH